MNQSFSVEIPPWTIRVEIEGGRKKIIGWIFNGFSSDAGEPTKEKKEEAIAKVEEYLKNQNQQFSLF